MAEPTSPSDVRAALQRRCDAIEDAYEFMLAYAGQGLRDDHGSPSGGQLREFLKRLDAAMTGLGQELSSLAEVEALEPRERYRAFIDVVENDARAARAAVQLVMAQASISSQLIDNLNASIHLRALLTDIFLVDEVLAQKPASAD